MRGRGGGREGVRGRGGGREGVRGRGGKHTAGNTAVYSMSQKNVSIIVQFRSRKRQLPFVLFAVFGSGTVRFCLENCFVSFRSVPFHFV